MELAPEILTAADLLKVQTVDGGVNPSWASQTDDSDETFPRSICNSSFYNAGGAQMCLIMRATRDAVRDSLGMVAGNPVDAVPFMQAGVYSIDIQSGAMALLGKTQNLRTMFSPAVIERRFYLYNTFEIKAGQHYVLSFGIWQNSGVGSDALNQLGAPQSNIRPPFGSGISSMSGVRLWSTRPSDDAYMPEAMNWADVPSTGSSYYPYLYLCTGGDML